ncbi:Panacea domain-containing protein [Burkholderia ubonensis]|uniref:Panacea domain-containing protein n=1 Tax=Burkholderia ubonensis TaxID=101571 RepID=UPI0009B33F52|nr:type II toxin-antitoxin system antitoxin SocA domain-containing protein [Burkholderia ubonensis]
MPLDAKAVANFFLGVAAAEGQSIDPMKLQKLVYYAHGWYAGYTGQPLINESVEAWPYGPVVPSLYHEFKQYGAGQIRSKACKFNGSDGFYEVPEPTDPNIRQFLANIWSSYGRFTGSALSQMTHAADGPWWAARRDSGGIRSADIPFESIAQHFQTAVQRTQGQAAQ